ncbi:CBS domain-containing membrane protein [Desulfofarcimen acetoxidans DSM 771]|uniref:CBS domain-containing membrane protein n=1 Tax=Desulfofarcimen acetoxidans (strain ATCC 49208 / DSM 771 / KCTC 5769 / VKM B-1644 / 5575) TaxID=485916 RepID=C8W1U9_DESAS|nr:CBS domain-containing protein [Desulfofarcimen acetoxidans]ACV63570.1 CBS domain-containing membrane protein [Desulfofarcimen acetoxidans DSM 771]
MEKVTVKDIMTKEVIAVGPDDNVEKVARLLLDHNISGLPVIDEKGKVVGIISEGDLIIQEKEIKAPAMTTLLGGVIFLENPNRFLKELKKIIAVEVKDLMTRKVYSVGPEATIAKVTGIMSEKRINRIPVLNDEGKLLGIITRKDIIENAFKKGN